MSVKKPKLALCLIVKGDDEEALNLERCLGFSAQSVDGIFITITQPNEKVEKVARSFNAHISHFEWSNDFSAARNFNFQQVPKEYTHILWLDADDGLRGIEKLKREIASQPNADTFIMNYLYAFDEDRNPVVVHMKTQVVKNNGCVTWLGAIHEDLSPTRDITPYFITDVERIHLSKGDRIERSKERNLTISREQTELNPDDPRSWWNLGNSYRAQDKYQESIDAFDKFLVSSHSDEEKYLCRIRRAECRWAMGDKYKAIEEAQFAIGLKPGYPDAYHVLGNLYIETSQHEQAVNVILQGLVKKPPKYSILVYNPRDYDYAPMKNLAKAYWMLNRPDLALPLLEGCLKVMPSDEKTKAIVTQLKIEDKIFREALKVGERIKKLKTKSAIKRNIEKLSPELQAHPAIAVIKNSTFIKETSSGKDIVFYCGNTGEVWNPEVAQTKGIGGSEEAVIWISKLLARKGWNVEVYANCGTEDKVYDGVKWKPFWTWNLRDRQDVVILWRHPAALKFDINAKAVYMDLHDVIQDGEFTPERLKKITKVFVKSEFHKSLFPSVPEDKFVVVPNGIDPTIFETQRTQSSHAATENGDYKIRQNEIVSERDPMLMVNTSSADRSLSALLDCYEEIKKQVPEAKLQWAYGFGVMDISHGDDQKMMEWKDTLIKRMEALGVANLGRVSHSQVAEMYKKANIFAYPSEFAEIDCISLSKAMAAGAVPITTSFAAMGEKQGHGGVFIHSDKTKDNWSRPYQFDYALEDPEKKREFIENAVRFLKNPPSEEARESMRDWARFTFDWERVVERWNEELTKDTQ